MFIENHTNFMTNARDLFRAAYENRYTWDEKFPGYSANIQVIQGDETYQAKIKINADLTTEVSDIEDEQVKKSIEDELQDIIRHRKRSSFDTVHGKNEFTLGKTDDQGSTEILVKGDAMGSNYKINGKIVSQVSRVMNGMAFVIDTLETVDTGNGYVPKRYDVVFRNAQTNEITDKRQHQLDLIQVGNYYILSREVMTSNNIITEFNFSNIVLNS
ncbi:MAG TPA: DUF3386 domain-containing protein [Allocoleopsis sp.]